MPTSDKPTVSMSNDDDGTSDFSRKIGKHFKKYKETTLPNSPYVESDIVSLDAGKSATRFLIHSSILQPSKPLFALSSKGQPVSLPTLDEAAAHTLVHYLYAGMYQIRFLVRTNDNAAAFFRHSTCVYCAAVQYELPGLAELSKEHIANAGEDLSIFDILKVARDYAFSLLPESDTWYSEYLEGVIRRAMHQDPEPFRRPDFITKVEGNSRLLQVVWKTVMCNYQVAEAPTSAEPPPAEGAETPVAESLLENSEMSTHENEHQLPSPTESDRASPLPLTSANDLEEPPHYDLASSASVEDQIRAQASPGETESTSQTNDDDFDLPSIEPTFEHSKVPETVASPLGEAKKGRHVRADSVLEADVATSEASTDNAKPDVVGEAVPAVSSGHQETMKKGKKKKGKKSSNVF